MAAESARAAADAARAAAERALAEERSRPRAGSEPATTPGTPLGADPARIRACTEADCRAGRSGP